MNLFTIKDLENLSGIKAHTIRIWEQRYSFIKPERTDTNIRHYSSEELKKILNVALLNKYGFKISHIDRMSDGEINEKIIALNTGDAQQERVVNELIKSMVDIDIEKLELILDKYIATRGIEKAIAQIIFPFMEKIGILWLTNHINPAQEHLVTNVIRQKLIVGIDRIVSMVKINKTIVLFLPEGEYHEMGLLFVYYLFKSRGVNAMYLGANVPLKDVEYIVKLKKPDYIYTHLTAVGKKFKLETFLSTIAKKFSSTPIIISGQLTHNYQKKLSGLVKFKKTFAEVMAFISGLG